MLGYPDFNQVRFFKTLENLKLRLKRIKLILSSLAVIKNLTIV